MNQVKNRDGQSSSCSTINDISETFDVQLLKNKTGLGFSIAGGVGTEILFFSIISRVIFVDNFANKMLTNLRNRK